MYQQLKIICRLKVCRMDVFWTNLVNVWQNILCTHKKLPAPTPPKNYIQVTILLDYQTHSEFVLQANLCANAQKSRI